MNKYYIGTIIDHVITQPEFKIPPQKAEIQKLIDMVKPGDTVITSSLVNFSRAYITMVEKLNEFIEKGVRVIAPAENYDSDKYKDLPWIAQYEWQKKYDKNSKIVIRKNQAQGIERAKQKGKFKGHGEITLKDLKGFDSYYAQLMNHQITKTEMAKELGISRPTLDKLIKSVENIETKEN